MEVGFRERSGVDTDFLSRERHGLSSLTKCVHIKGRPTVRQRPVREFAKEQGVCRLFRSPAGVNDRHHLSRGTPGALANKPEKFCQPGEAEWLR